ncbi:MAG TPA: response regulator [Candidatus Acidoferrum sp.]|nr:response regulator [Candidatus Acidoferrum sp.]
MAAKVLVVDDEPWYVKLVASRLKSAGYDVLTADGGEEGLRQCKLFRPDLAVLDIMMPGMAGGSVAEAMRDDPMLQHVPVLFLTSLVTKGEAGKARVPGGPYYLAKPFKGEELLELVRRALGIRL